MPLHARLAGAGIAALLLAGAAYAAQQPTASPAAKGEEERPICRSMQETGSLARRRRQCYTRAEWDRIAEAARARGQRLTSDMASGMVSN